MASLPYLSSENQPFGSVVLTINGVSYVALNWNPTKNSRTIIRRDENGDPAELQIRDELADNSVTLQLATTNTAVPDRGQTFTQDGVEYVIQTVQKSEPQGDFHTVDIQFTESLSQS